MSSQRKNIMLGTAGHVDHGKTALVKLLTGCNTDTLAEEQRRGMTIDLGFAPCHLSGDRLVGIVDVPGHADFIRNMVAGAHGIDVVILVVAADDSVMPQTREHLAILTLMGLRHGLVALTKTDLVDAEQLAMVVEEVRTLLTGTFLAQAPICPLSTITGAGFDGFYDALTDQVNGCDDRPSSGLFHLWVADIFSIHGVGTVVTGIPSRGRVRVGDALEAVPAGLKGRVRRLQVYNEEAQEGRAGECVAMNLAEIDHQALRRGMVLCEPDTILPVTMVEAELQMLASATGELKDYDEVHLHIGTAAVQARVAMLEESRMTPGQKQMVQLRMDEPLALVPGERFVVRANTRAGKHSGLATIGGGRILGVSNVRLRRRRQWTIGALAARRDAIDATDTWCGLLLEQATAPLSLSAWAALCGMRLDEFQSILAHLKSTGTVLETSDAQWVHRHSVGQAAAKAIDILRAFHSANPQCLGMESGQLREAVGTDAFTLALAIQKLSAERSIKLHANLAALADWTPKVADAVETLGGQIVTRLQEARWAVPSPAELAVALAQPVQKVQAAIRLSVERGVLVQLDPQIVLHRDAIQAASQVALRLFSCAPSFSTMEFRDALGVSRKYAVPILDHLDATRFTVRSGNLRTPGAMAKKAMVPGAGPAAA